MIGTRERRCKDCAQPAAEGSARCETHRTEHNARETDRREARRKAGLCRVCGHKAVVVDGQPLAVCKTHRAYYAARGRAARKASA